MERLKDRIRAEATYLGGGIVKVDSFLNHQIDPTLTLEMGEAFRAAFLALDVTQVTRIVTAEVSGIAPAMAAGIAYRVPIVFARKKRPITMPSGYYMREVHSHTKGGIVPLMISPEFLNAADTVLIVDDFLATGRTLLALIDVVQQSGAAVAGVGCVIEKPFEGGRDALAALGIPVVTLAQVSIVNGTVCVT